MSKKYDIINKSLIIMITLHELLKKKADFNKYIANKMKDIKKLSVDEKKLLGQELNQEKKQFYDEFIKTKAQIEKIAIDQKLQSSKIDVTIPGKRSKIGSINLITASISKLNEICSALGFKVYEGPSLDSDWYNFEALNISKNHPARSMSDTFFVNDDIVLRTHTSNMQIRVMEKNKPPFKFISLGRVYRKDSDATHVPMFHQMEGVVVNKNANFLELKSMLQYILESFFECKIKMRFRNSYFPFTSPSFEVDIFVNGKWLEVLGSGIIHSNVFKNCNIDESVKGYAFGMGIERLTMIKYSIEDVSCLLYTSDAADDP